MFTAVLVANRGEIAVRICRTLRRMGVRSVVVASIPDRRSLAVRTAEEVVFLDGYTPTESYLDIDAIIAAAKSTGCEAIHPGYGFLSERADFAERCAAEGLTFVGPPPSVLRALGDKSAARQLAVGLGVPVVPGWDGADDDATLEREAERIGLPVMVKARGGGGGRGMRPVSDLADLPGAVESARREALSAFGDGGLLIEKLITGAHHVEIQVLADSGGQVIHLGERDCSVQRRRQKLIEESPSPVVDDALRARLTGAALRIARAAGYVNAGTVEFLVQPSLSGRGDDATFYFLEVNPRLQVEHPVTEMVTGLDLVELQLRVAAGEPLALAQDDVPFAGHAIEFRINAEDPWDDFRPGAGRIEESTVSVTLGPRGVRPTPVRIDTGYEDGDSVSSHYDSLLRKVIVLGRDRADALKEAENALRSRLGGIATNNDLHKAILDSPTFAAGEATIDWLESELESLLGQFRHAPEVWAAAALGLHHCRNEFFPASRQSPFTERAGWIGAGPSTIWLRTAHDFKAVTVKSTGRRSAVVTVDGEALPCEWVSDALAGLVVGLNQQPLEPTIGYHNIDTVDVNDGTRMSEFTIASPPPLPRRAVATRAGASAITAPLSGRVSAIRVNEGDAVESGQVVMLLEAMKMEHRITATGAGTVRRIAVNEGETVGEGDVLIELA